MITVYSQPGCARSRRIRQWFKENNIEYKSESLLSMLTDSREFEKTAASLTEPEKLADLEGLDCKTAEDSRALAEWLQSNPSALNRPLIVCDHEDEDSEALLSVKAFLENSNSRRCPASCPMLSFCAMARRNDCVPLLFSHSRD